MWSEIKGMDERVDKSVRQFGQTERVENDRNDKRVNAGVDKKNGA